MDRSKRLHMTIHMNNNTQVSTGQEGFRGDCADCSPGGPGCLPDGLPALLLDDVGDLLSSEELFGVLLSPGQ